jgi:anti-sigma regulatory factor (Ser/Thr protein kinase)
MTSGSSTLNATLDLPSAAPSAAAARRLMAQLLEAWAAESFRDDATLLVSELVSNVVRHVAGHLAMRVEVALSGPSLRVAVVDSSTVLPAPTSRRPRGGYGLGLIAAVADRWGSEEYAGGKRIWFELGPRRSSGVTPTSEFRPAEAERRW